MAQTTANYNLNIAEGTDTVNLLTQCYPNFTSLDSIIKGIDDNAITVASETKSGTVHQLVRTSVNRDVIRFTATSNYTLGDTFTVDGTPVTAVTIAGTALQTGDFVINSNVFAILNGAQLTVLVGGSAPSSATDISYDNTGSGLTATNVQDAIDEVLGDIPANAAAVSYDNTVSGLTATDVQAAIDELKALIPATPQYVTTGLSTANAIINSGGYYIDNGTVYVDITVTTIVPVAAGYGLINGFPQAPGGANIHVTGTFNQCYIGNDSIAQTKLFSDATMSSGETRHYIGSYVM